LNVYSYTWTVSFPYTTVVRSYRNENNEKVFFEYNGWYYWIKNWSKHKKSSKPAPHFETEASVPCGEDSVTGVIAVQK
jgi:hypothetical protein